MNPASRLVFKDAGTGQVTVFHYCWCMERSTGINTPLFPAHHRIITLTGTMII